MRTLALLLAVIGVSAAATIYGMNGRQLEDAMMEAFASNPSSMGAAMGIGTLMSDEPAPEAHADDEGAVERGARGTDQAHGHNPFGAMMGMMFPEMMFPSHDAPQFPVAPNGHEHDESDGHSVSANGNGHSKPANGNGVPYSANGNGHAPVASGNGYHAPANGNGSQKPANGNGYARPPNGNGRPTNGKKPGGAAASAVSISRGPNSFSSSHAQAFNF